MLLRHLLRCTVEPHPASRPQAGVHPAGYCEIAPRLPTQPRPKPKSFCYKYEGVHFITRTACSCRSWPVSAERWLTNNLSKSPGQPPVTRFCQGEQANHHVANRSGRRTKCGQRLPALARGLRGALYPFSLLFSHRFADLRRRRDAKVLRQRAVHRSGKSTRPWWSPSSGWWL